MRFNVRMRLPASFVRARRSQSGAAAVEFALVSLALLPALLGLLQYGLYFNDAMQERMGIRQGVRLSVVKPSTFPAECPSSTYGTYAKQVACYVGKQVSPVTGPVAVKVTATSWTRGQPLIACVVVSSAASGAGVLPVPNGGKIGLKTQMSIEQSSGSVNGFPAYYDSTSTTPPSSLTDPTGRSWSWCS